MKNISRRVFIKGMAVAAVATAASTVLAGCNVPGTTEETAPVVGFVPETKTLTIGDEKVTISTTNFGVKANGDYQLDVKVVNDMDSNVTLKTDVFNDPYQMRVRAFGDGKVSREQTVTGFDGSVTKNETNKSYFTETSVTVEKSDTLKNSENIVFTFVLRGADVDNKAQTTEVSFTIKK